MKRKRSAKPDTAGSHFTAACFTNLIRDDWAS